MTITRTSRGTNTQTNGLTCAVSLAAIPVGDLIVVTASAAMNTFSNQALTNLTLTDTAGLTWTKVQRLTTGYKDTGAAIFYATSTNVTNTVTVTASVAGSNVVMGVEAYSFNGATAGQSVTAGGAGIAETVTLSAAPATSSIVLALIVASQAAAITLVPVSPATTILSYAGVHAGGAGYAYAAGASFRSTLAERTGTTATATSFTMSPNDNEYAQSMVSLELLDGVAGPTTTYRWGLPWK